MGSWDGSGISWTIYQTSVYLEYGVCENWKKRVEAMMTEQD